eukprot:scaffold2708_cov158-Ochromonas_danica.AAC.31
MCRHDAASRVGEEALEVDLHARRQARQCFEPQKLHQQKETDGSAQSQSNESSIPSDQRNGGVEHRDDEEVEEFAPTDSLPAAQTRRLHPHSDRDGGYPAHYEVKAVGSTGRPLSSNGQEKQRKTAAPTRPRVQSRQPALSASLFTPPICLLASIEGQSRKSSRRREAVVSAATASSDPSATSPTHRAARGVTSSIRSTSEASRSCRSSPTEA